MLGGCGASVGFTAGPIAPEAPGVTTGVNSGGTGAPADPLAAFTTIATFAPTARQSLEVINIAGSNVSPEASPSLTLAKTSTGIDMTISQGTVRYDTRPGSRDIAATSQYNSCISACTGGNTTLQRIVTTFNGGAASTLSYATYGAWTRALSATSVVGFGVFATGTPSTIAQMPTTGVATFTGTAMGFVVPSASADTASFTGTAALNTDFATRTITGQVSSIVTRNIATPATTGTLGTIVFGSGTYGSSGLTFSGMAAAVPQTGAAYDLTGATGQFAGVFYGPNAAEAAGSFNLTKTGLSLIGSFGVKR